MHRYLSEQDPECCQMIFCASSVFEVHDIMVSLSIDNRGEWLGKVTNFKRKPHCLRL